MAEMSQLERDTVAKICAVSKQVLNDLQAKIAGINEIYNSAGGVATTLSQEKLDAEPALSGITKQQVDDAAYALSTGILGGITTGYTALAQTAARNL
jgi:hypothetical protein